MQDYMFYVKLILSPDLRLCKDNSEQHYYHHEIIEKQLLAVAQLMLNI